MAIPQLLITTATLQGTRGSKTAGMIVDTGATMTIIHPQIALSIGCDPAKSDQRIPIITASGLEYLPVVRIPHIFCLGTKVTDFDVVCHALPPQSSVEGLLGLDFLLHVPAFIDFQAAIRALTQ